MGSKEILVGAEPATRFTGSATVLMALYTDFRTVCRLRGGLWSPPSFAASVDLERTTSAAIEIPTMMERKALGAGVSRLIRREGGASAGWRYAGGHSSEKLGDLREVDRRLFSPSGRLRPVHATPDQVKNHATRRGEPFQHGMRVVANDDGGTEAIYPKGPRHKRQRGGKRCGVRSGMPMFSAFTSARVPSSRPPLRGA